MGVLVTLLQPLIFVILHYYLIVIYNERDYSYRM